MPKTDFLPRPERDCKVRDGSSRSASQANRTAARLGEELARIPGICLTQKVEANEVFATFPREHIPRLHEQCFFHVWDEATTEVRLVTSLDTAEGEIMRFVQNVRTCANQ